MSCSARRQVGDNGQRRIRRRELEAESSFYGAMDGASKFVRGDAVAGLQFDPQVLGIADRDAQ